MANLNGKWKLVSAENFKEYLDALGLKDEVKDKAMKLLSPGNNITQEITVSGNDITIITTTPAGASESKAVIGTESAQTFLDGSPIQVTYKLDGEKLVEEQKGPFDSVNVRSLEDGQLIMRMTSGSGVACTRKYDKM